MSEKDLLREETLEQVSGGGSLGPADAAGADRCPTSPSLRHHWEAIPEKPGSKVCRWCGKTRTAQG